MQWSRWPGRWKAGGGIAALAIAGTLFTGAAGSVFAAANTATPSAASTTSSQTSPVQQFEDQLAKNLGITTDQLKTALQTAQDQEIDAAVAGGKLTQAQGDTLKQQVASGQDLPFLFGPGPGFGGRHGGFGPQSDLIASTLGITEQQLQSELSAGSTLKQVIAAHGKTVDDVVNAIVAQDKTRLDQAVQSGNLTQAQETQRLDTLKQDLTNGINNNTLDLDRHGHGGFGLPAPSGNQSSSPSG